MFAKAKQIMDKSMEYAKGMLIPTMYAQENPVKHSCDVCIDSGKDIVRGSITEISRNIYAGNDKTGENVNSGPSESEIGCLAYMHSECPLNRRELGRVSWAYLHTLAAYYPDNPTQKQKDEMREFVQTYARLYPCGYCADKTRDEMIRKPPKVDNQKEFSYWMCQIHNEVNDRLGKPIFNCDKVTERWKTGPEDGSCGR